MTVRYDVDEVTELIALARTGAPEAGPYLVSLCGAQLAEYARLIAPGLSEADREAICERAVERAVRRIDRFVAKRASFESWLRGFVRTMVNERRQVRLIPTDPARLPEPAAPDPDPVPDGGVGANLRDAVLRLSDPDQLIIRLRQYEQLDYRSIAQLLDVDEAACRKRHARAMARLRELIEQDATLAPVLGRGADR